jgi:hypothetical protein
MQVFSTTVAVEMLVDWLVVSLADLAEPLESTSWEVRQWRNRRSESLHHCSAKVWGKHSMPNARKDSGRVELLPADRSCRPIRARLQEHRFREENDYCSPAWPIHCRENIHIVLNVSLQNRAMGRDIETPGRKTHRSARLFGILRGCHDSLLRPDLTAWGNLFAIHTSRV